MSCPELHWWIVEITSNYLAYLRDWKKIIVFLEQEYYKLKSSLSLFLPQNGYVCPAFAKLLHPISTLLAGQIHFYALNWYYHLHHHHHNNNHHRLGRCQELAVKTRGRSWIIHKRGGKHSHHKTSSSSPGLNKFLKWIIGAKLPILWLVNWEYTSSTYWLLFCG